jgi:hypothetical protein
MFHICIPPSGTGRDCFFVPVYIRRWKDLFPPEPPFLRLLRPVRVALIEVLMGPRPHPWREAGVRIAPEVERDLAALSSMHSLAEDLSPGLREAVRETLRNAVGGIPLPEGVSVRA